MVRPKSWAWVIPAVLAVLVVVAAVDVGLLLRHHAPPKSQAIPQKIGLTALPDGDALRVEWNRKADPVRRADHAVLYIEDGTHKSRLNLTSAQLTSAGVRYWPETQTIHFRLELNAGNVRTSDETQAALAAPTTPPATRTVVERVRPSPFERPRQKVARAEPASEEAPPPARQLAEVPAPVHRESGWSKVISRIPLLRRLKKHPQATETQAPDDTARQ
jgi:hypothetical protein